MAFFSELGDFQAAGSTGKSVAHFQCIQGKPLDQQIFAKCTKFQLTSAVRLELLEALQGQQADLPMPVSCMCIPDDAPVRTDFCFLHRCFHGPFLFTAVD